MDLRLEIALSRALTTPPLAQGCVSTHCWRSKPRYSDSREPVFMHGDETDLARVFSGEKPSGTVPAVENSIVWSLLGVSKTVQSTSGLHTNLQRNPFSFPLSMSRQANHICSPYLPLHLKDTSLGSWRDISIKSSIQGQNVHQNHTAVFNRYLDVLIDIQYSTMKTKLKQIFHDYTEFELVLDLQFKAPSPSGIFVVNLIGLYRCHLNKVIRHVWYKCTSIVPKTTTSQWPHTE